MKHILQAPLTVLKDQIRFSKMMGVINIVFLQWFFIRICWCRQRVITKYKLYEVSLVAKGTYAPGGDLEYENRQWFALHGWVVPLTGWKSRSLYIGKKWFIDLTKPKKVK